MSAEIQPVGKKEQEHIKATIESPFETISAMQGLFENGTTAMKQALSVEGGVIGAVHVSTMEGVIDEVYAAGKSHEYTIAGDFVDEAGNSRNRYIMRLDTPEATLAHPVLKHVALKVIPKSDSILAEMDMHEAVQEAVADQEYIRVPKVLGTVALKEADYRGVLIERLPRDAYNNSLQGFISSARLEGVVVRLSDDVYADVLSAYEGLHNAGFTHNDINEGNIYLTNVDWRDVVIGKRKFRFLASGEVIVLDFEKTARLRGDKITKKHELDQERKAVADMMELYAVDVGGEDEEEDVEEALEQSVLRR